MKRVHSAQGNWIQNKGEYEIALSSKAAISMELGFCKEMYHRNELSPGKDIDMRCRNVDVKSLESAAVDGN